MDTAKAINPVGQTEDVETTTNDRPDTLPKPAPGVMRDTPLRYGLLLGIVVVSAWLATTALNLIGELDVVFQQIYTIATLPIR